MRPPPCAISAASSGAAPRNAPTAGAGSHSADSQRPHPAQQLGQVASAKPSQARRCFASRIASRRSCRTARADPFGVGEPAGSRIPTPRRELRPAMTEDGKAQVDRPGKGKRCRHRRTCRSASEGEKLSDNSTKATYPARNRRGRRHIRKGRAGSCRVGCSASRHSRLRVPNAGPLLPDIRPTLNRKWIDATGRIRWPEQYGFAETSGADRRRALPSIE